MYDRSNRAPSLILEPFTIQVALLIRQLVANCIGDTITETENGRGATLNTAQMVAGLNKLVGAAATIPR